LDRLRTLFEKQPAAPSRRRGKKRKGAIRRYKAVTENEAVEIWSRYLRGQTASTIARELLLRQNTVFMAIKRMRLRDGHHIDAQILNGRKTVRKITPAVEKLLLDHKTL
jgi:DNA-binding CsgD family transcriptional regulator